jgi:hypothetical protein
MSHRRADRQPILLINGENSTFWRNCGPFGNASKQTSLKQSVLERNCEGEARGNLPRSLRELAMTAIRTFPTANHTPQDS